MNCPAEMQFQREIHDLLGKRIIDELCQFITVGTIGRFEVEKISFKMKTIVVFNECQGRQMDLIDTLCRMLDRWYQDYIFSLQPAEAKARLIDILRNSCAPVVVENIKNLALTGSSNISPPFKDVPDMLRQLNLTELLPIFVKEELDLCDVADLTSEDLIEIGVTQLKQRKVILKAVQDLKLHLDGN